MNLHRERCHQTNNLLRVLGLFSSWNEGRIEIRGEVLVENLELWSIQLAQNEIVALHTFTLGHSGRAVVVAGVVVVRV